MKTRGYFKALLGLLIFSSPLSAAVVAYVSNAGSNTLSVIDTSTNLVTATIEVGFFPTGIAADPAGTFVYAPLFSDDAIYAIATSTNTLQNTIATRSGSKPTAIATTPSGIGYVANFSNATVLTFDPQSMQIDNAIPVGAIFPVNLAALPDGTRVYVANGIGPKNIKVIDTTSNMVIATINTGTQSFGIAASPDSSKVYVTNSLQSTVSVIDTATNTVTSTIALAANAFPRGVIFSPSGTRAYVAQQGLSSLAVIDTTGIPAVISTIALSTGKDPYNVAITPDGLFAYVTQTLDNTVAVVDLTLNTFTTVSVGTFPYDVKIVTVP